MVSFSTQSYAQLATSPALGLQEQLWNLRVEIGCYRSNMDFSFGWDVVGQTGVGDAGRLARSFHQCLMTDHTGVCKWITSGSKADFAAQPTSN